MPRITIFSSKQIVNNVYLSQKKPPMANILLEFEQLNIHVKKKIWKLYFIVVAEHPKDPDKMMISTIPAAGQDYFRLKKHSKNKVFFEPEATDNGVDGLFVLEREMPSASVLICWGRPFPGWLWQKRQLACWVAY